MKVLVDCDYVFDVLTRGPFPNDNEPAEPIEQHLACCHECRQLAEALRPSVELMHEALSESERKTLPEFRDPQVIDRIRRNITEAVFDTEEEQTAAKVERVCQRWLSPALVIVPIVAAVLIMMFGMPLLSRTSPSVLANHQAAEEFLTSLAIPQGCLTTVHWNECETVDGRSKCLDCHDEKSIKNGGNAKKRHVANYHCCSACHAPVTNGQKQPAIDMSLMLSSCSVCHDS